MQNQNRISRPGWVVAMKKFPLLWGIIVLLLILPRGVLWGSGVREGSQKDTAGRMERGGRAGSVDRMEKPGKSDRTEGVGTMGEDSAFQNPALPRVSFPLEIRDSYNRKVRLEKPPQRIVSCAPNMTEIVFYLGEGKRMVGRTDWCNWPEEVKTIPSIGGLQDPNVEKILSLKPDLVLASSHFQKETVELLESVRIPVYVGLASREYEEVYRLIRSVGLLLGIPEAAEAKVQEMQTRMEAIRIKAEGAPYKPRVYYMISFGDEGDYTAGADTHIAQLIRWAGGRNVGDVIKGWRFSTEGLVREDPDILLVRKGGAIVEQLKHLSPYRDLRAVREGRVYEIDIDLIDRMGPRNVEGLRQLAKLIHPELDIP